MVNNTSKARLWSVVIAINFLCLSLAIQSSFGAGKTNRQIKSKETASKVRASDHQDLKSGTLDTTSPLEVNTKEIEDEKENRDKTCISNTERLKNIYNTANDAQLVHDKYIKQQADAAQIAEYKNSSFKKSKDRLTNKLKALERPSQSIKIVQIKDLCMGHPITFKSTLDEIEKRTSMLKLNKPKLKKSDYVSI